MDTAAIATLISSKVNQWPLLIVYSLYDNQSPNSPTKPFPTANTVGRQIHSAAQALGNRRLPQHIPHEVR
ncbi:hypothetical protein [Nocardia macrotermitis]|uniref:Uncharacterized protein n=1 Tax=Nocardia macrotermitis TaxID=2585198 RepID=A0A7K0DF03_9NOCA|nr:hypothetical protein [Nocardia macrotermitis]MQY24366.1 hypothetical protein [Nocardia macrotermitis]